MDYNDTTIPTSDEEALSRIGNDELRSFWLAQQNVDHCALIVIQRNEDKL